MLSKLYQQVIVFTTANPYVFCRKPDRPTACLNSDERRRHKRGNCQL